MLLDGFGSFKKWIQMLVVNIFRKPIQLENAINHEMQFSVEKHRSKAYLTSVIISKWVMLLKMLISLI